MKNVKLYLNHAGYCEAKANHAVKGAARETIRFHALFGLIQHPNLGWILYDTGYTNRFFEATRNYPNKIYAKITKVVVPKGATILEQLTAFGLDETDIKHIIITHFHADHVAGLKDFPNAQFYCSKKAYHHAININSFFAFSKGILKDLIPDDIEQRVNFIEDISTQKAHPIFGTAYDIFNDNSILAFDLSGHAVGQIGIQLKTDKADYLLAADACWDEVAYKELKLPSPIVRTFFTSWKTYKANVHKLHQFHKTHPEVIIVPTHCSKTTHKLIQAPGDINAL